MLRGSRLAANDRSYGVPFCTGEDGDLRQVRVAVAGYGKIGGLELGYASTWTWFFCIDSCGACQQTQGDRPLDNGVFFLRLGQRIVHLLTMHSAAGRLYEVDMRLRPNGKGGFLMTGIDAFEALSAPGSVTWDTRRCCAPARCRGCSLCAGFEAARRRILTAAVHRDTLRTDVAEMRARMRRELSKAGEAQFDIKQTRAVSRTSSFWCNTGCCARRPPSRSC